MLIGEACASLPAPAHEHLRAAVRELTYNQQPLSVALADALVATARGERELSLAAVEQMQDGLDPYATALAVGLLAPRAVPRVRGRVGPHGEAKGIVARIAPPPSARTVAAVDGSADAHHGCVVGLPVAPCPAAASEPRAAALQGRIAAARATSPRLAASLDRVDALLVATRTLSDAVSRELDAIDRQAAGQSPADEKFSLDQSTWGGAWLIRHARRHAARGRTVRAAFGFGIGYPLGAIAVAMGVCSLGLMVVPPVLAAAAWRENGRVPRRSPAGVREDAILRAVSGLDGALRALCGPELAALLAAGVLTSSDVVALGAAARGAALTVRGAVAASANGRLASHAYLAGRLRHLASNRHLERALDKAPLSGWTTGGAGSAS